jgi:hypothetical protein
MSSGQLWINEKRFNKSGRVGGKTLIGNWHEEQRLETDVGLLPGTTIDTNKKGAESTPFLISSIPKGTRSMAGECSEQNAQFNIDNSDVTLLRPAKLGVRSMLRAQAILDEAKLRVQEEEEKRRRVDAAKIQSAAAEATEKTGIRGPALMVVDPYKELAYKDDVPITLYTGCPTTGETMRAIPGRTSITPGAPNPMAKNSFFSCDKYVYSLSGNMCTTKKY